MKLLEPPIEAIRKILELVKAGEFASKDMLSAVADVVHWLIKSLLEPVDGPAVFSGSTEFSDAVFACYEELAEAPVAFEGPLTDAMLYRLVIFVIEQVISRVDDELLKEWALKLVDWLREKLGA